MGEYYEKRDLEDFGNIGEYAPELGRKYFDYYGETMRAGNLSEREKSLIALAVAATQKCPYCIDAYTNQCLSLGISKEEMMEAVHVGAAMMAGVVLAHSTQIRKIIKKRKCEMDLYGAIPAFEQKISGGLNATGIDILQINLGYRCNLECRHCHVEAGPLRQEAMPKAIMEECLEVLKTHSIPTIDITGGSPEMHPHLDWFLQECEGLNRRLLVRTNGVILLQKEYERFMGLYAASRAEIVLSFPHMNQEIAERQRGEGIFNEIIEAMRRLNELGYGQPDTGLILDLVHNPVGAYLPGPQVSLEADYRRRLENEQGVFFNHLFCITNMPIGRYLDFLRKSDNLDDYMAALIKAYNPAALKGVMCKSTLSVGWDGRLFDCDFNQTLGLATNHGAPDHIQDFDMNKLAQRRIVTGNHCYGCTAGAGSSCQGEVV